MSKVSTNWLNLPPDFSPEDWAGFVYLIVDTVTSRKYIGKKFFWSLRKMKVKGQKRRKLVKKESDWKHYKSSSEELKAAIKEHGVDRFEFIILSLHKTRAEVNYSEVKEQFSRDVLYSKINDEYEYFNHCILNRYWRKS